MLRKLFKGRRSKHKTAPASTSKNEDLLVRFILSGPGIQGEYLLQELLRIFDVPADDPIKREKAVTHFLDVFTDIDISIHKLFACVVAWDDSTHAKTYGIEEVHTFIADHNLLNE